ncbi:MAG: type II secretion system F family protein [Acidimicrobiia bacterium]|nr:type II secretion system F family protein [Acidimicrobiia bacterium]
MDPTQVVAMVLVALGFALLVVGALSRIYDREEQLADILDLPYGEQDVDLSAVATQSSVVENLSGLAGKMVVRLDERGSLTTMLEKARVPMRTGEFVVVVVSLGVVLGALLGAVTGAAIVGFVAFLVSPLVARAFLSRRIEKRKKKFEDQFPDALSLIASSLTAGHTFLRSISLMCEESPPPLSEEFARVVNETQLGDPLVDALARMGDRLQIRDVDWVVQAIRIQQQVGGRLADLLHTLADFIRAREEVRREVQVLTAEGRISAYVLGGLPVFLLVAISAMSPGYMDPMFTGWGPIVLIGAAMWAGLGMMFILRMVKVDV